MPVFPDIQPWYRGFNGTIEKVEKDKHRYITKGVLTRGKGDVVTVSVIPVNMSIDSIKPKLYIWASIGFPSSYMVSTFELTAPATCSDGVRRTHLEYFEYLINGKINDWLNSMNAKTSGMYFTFSHNGYSCINLHISK